jgi:hypothetical protein
MTVLILCLLLGMVLGQRFRAPVLVPATGAVLALTIAGQMMQTPAIWPLLLITLAAAASLQVGYLFGLGIRYVLVGIPTHRLDESPLPGAGPTQRSVH